MAKRENFLGCPGFPECPFTSNFKRNEQGEIELIKPEAPTLLDEKCPKCGKQLRQLPGKFGPFIACSGYPECKYIQQNTAGFACPLCKTGDIVERIWRGGKFWGCSNYPKCKFAIFDAIEKTPCPQCNWPFLIVRQAKDGTTVHLCANKECPGSK